MKGMCILKRQVTELIIWLGRKLVALLAFGIPGYRELFCRGLSFFAIFVGHSPINLESYLRGLTYKKFSEGKKILVGRHVIFNEGKGKVSIGKQLGVGISTIYRVEKENQASASV